MLVIRPHPIPDHRVPLVIANPSRGPPFRFGHQNAPPECARLSPHPASALSLSLHRHPYLYIPRSSCFIRYNKQMIKIGRGHVHLSSPFVLYSKIICSPAVVAS